MIYAQVAHESPDVNLAGLAGLEQEMTIGMAELTALLQEAKA